MPLSKIQIDILRLLAGHRDPESYVAGATPLNRNALRYARLQKTNPREWARYFDAWVDSHDLNTPVLSDEAMSRKSIYPDPV